MRTPMITRTFKVTVVGVLCLNIESAEPFVKEVELPRTYKNDEAILKSTLTLLRLYPSVIPVLMKFAMGCLKLTSSQILKSCLCLEAMTVTTASLTKGR